MLEYMIDNTVVNVYVALEHLKSVFTVASTKEKWRYLIVSWKLIWLICINKPSAGDRQPESRSQQKGKKKGGSPNPDLIKTESWADQMDEDVCGGDGGTQGGCPTGWLNNWQCRTRTAAQSSSQQLSEWESDWSWVTRCIGAGLPRGWIPDPFSPPARVIFRDGAWHRFKLFITGEVKLKNF